MSSRKGRNKEMVTVKSCALNLHLLGLVLVGRSATFGMMKMQGNSQSGVSVLTFLTTENVKEVQIATLSIVYRMKMTVPLVEDLLGPPDLTGCCYPLTCPFFLDVAVAQISLITGNSNLINSANLDVDRN